MREREREGATHRGRPRLPQRSRRPRVNGISIEFVRAPAAPPPSRLGKVERKAKKARKNKKLARVPRNVMRGVFTPSFEKTRVCREGECTTKGSAPRAWVGGVVLRKQNDSSFKFADFFDGVCIENLGRTVLPACRPVFLTPSLLVPCFVM